MMRDFKILIVDDTPKNIQVVASILQPLQYQLAYATDGTRALAMIEKNNYDLILLDVMMPGMDGYEVCQQIKKIEQYKEVPVIFLTARTDLDSVIKGFDSGGNDYVSKPFNAPELVARVKTQLHLKAFEDSQQETIDAALAKLRALNQEIIDTQREVVFTIGAIAESRSKETGNHVRRVAEYSQLLGQLAGLPSEETELLKLASPMHDVGKVGIPDSILNKPGKHTPEEWEIMKTHAQLGHDMLQHSSRPILKTAAIIALEHHEKWDGSGYPRGLKGGQIHIHGRITALADVYDALGSSRCYKEAWEDERIYTFLKEQAGFHLDPDLVKLFFDNLDPFLKIRESFKDD